MTRRGLWVLSSLAWVLVACRNDHGSAGDQGGSGTDSDGGADESPASEGGNDGGNGSCQSDADCDDANPCTQNTCEADGTCTSAPVVSNACRPVIEVDYPPRAATLLSEQGDPSVTVTGTVRSGTGAITGLNINGESVTVGEDGRFSHEVTAQVGGNVLILETTDAFELTRKRVQSFVWATAYDLPTVAKQGMSAEGFAFFLGQDALDDGDHSLPADDFATLFDLALSNFDIGQFADPTTPIAQQAGYDIYLTDLEFGSSTASLLAIDDGLRIRAGVKDILGDLVFDCTTFTCELAGGDGTGGLSVDVVQITADVFLIVAEDHSLEVQIAQVQTAIDPDDVDIWSNNAWTNFLLSIIKPFIIDGVVADIAGELDSQIETMLAPALGEGLGALALDTVLDFPNISDPDVPIAIHLVTDFAGTSFHNGTAPPSPSPPQGGLILQRGGAYVETTVTPYENLGVPVRNACAAGGTPLDLPRDGQLEIGLTDDVLNQILHAAWRGGMLQFEAGDALLGGGGGGGGFGAENLQLQASGMAAPTASDCNDTGSLLTQIGDLRLDATLEFFGDPMSFVAYSTLVVRLGVGATDDGIGLGIDGIERVDTELTVMEDAFIETEPLITSVLEDQLSGAIVDMLGGGALGGISLPEIDLSAQLGLPPGSAVIHIQTASVEHMDGVTVVTAHL